MLSQHFLYISPDPWPNAQCCSNNDDDRSFHVSTAKTNDAKPSKKKGMLNVYRVIGPIPSFPSAHTTLALGKHTLMRR